MRKIIITLIIVILLATMVFTLASCSPPPNGVIGVKTSDVARVNLTRFARSSYYESIQYAVVDITDSETVQALFDEVNSVEYTKGSLVVGTPNGYYRINIFDKDDELIKSVTITGLSKIYIGNRYYDANKNMSFDFYDELLEDYFVQE